MPRLIFVSMLMLLCALPAGAQSDDTYLDPTARELVLRAREARGRQGSEIESYTALVSQRMAARLRLPLRDRLLGREESAMRVRWSRDGGTVIHQLAARSEELGSGPNAKVGVNPGSLFDPQGDRIYFGIDVGGLIEPVEGRRTRQAAMDSAAAAAADSAAAAAASGADGSSVAVRVGTGGVDVNADIRQEELSDFWIAHPLAEGSEEYYRYRSGDTLTLRLPGGRTIRSVELNAIPRAASFHHLRASLWLEPETGALVRAIYRPARDLDVFRDTAFIDAESVDDASKIPGMFRPIVFDLELMTVEYSLWNQRHWLPHRMSMEGYVRAGVVRIPFESEIAYRVEQVEDEPVPVPPTPAEVLAAWGVDAATIALDTLLEDSLRTVVARPTDERELLRSELLPPPVWEDAPAFLSSGEIEAFAERLEEMIPGRRYAAPLGLELQYLQRGRGLVRYNRVEALSLGVRGVLDHARARVLATVRLGAADLHPNVELAALLPRRSVAWRAEAYHRLTTVEPIMPGFEGAEPALGIGNSIGALLFGRDDGFYYRATGATLALEPRPQERQSWRVAAFVEQHDAARRKVEWNVASWIDDDRRFAPNIEADEDLFAGVSLLLSPWWGVGLGPQAGLEVFGEVVEPDAGAFAFDATFARARVTGRTVLPLTSGLRLGTEAAVGHAWGALPLQYNWFLGGAETVRGYPAGAAVGESMARARVELARGSTAVGLSLFADGAWAGRRADFDADDALLSAGVGLTLLDGLLRVDVARALAAPTGWRMHFYLDALL